MSHDIISYKDILYLSGIYLFRGEKRKCVILRLEECVDRRKAASTY